MGLALFLGQRTETKGTQTLSRRSYRENTFNLKTCRTSSIFSTSETQRNDYRNEVPRRRKVLTVQLLLK